MKIFISGDYIKLGQLLKKIGKISTGGRAKRFIQNHDIKINGDRPLSRHFKIKIHDILWIDDNLYKIENEEK